MESFLPPLEHALGREVKRRRIHSIAQSFNHSCIDPTIESFVQAFIHAFIHTFIDSFKHANVYSFSDSIVHGSNDKHRDGFGGVVAW